MEQIVGLKEFRMDVEKYVKATSDGKSIVVMRRSKPFFKIVSVDDDSAWETVADFTHVKKGGVNINDLLSRI